MRGRTVRELQIIEPDIQFTEWYVWDDLKSIPNNNKRGIYLIAQFDQKPEGHANPLDESILYIGETHGKSQSIFKRLNTFFKAARIGDMIHKHSGGNRFNRELNGDLTNVYVSAYTPLLENENYLNPFILYVERKIIWDYVTKHTKIPRCNGY
jgi:hypothetical protein